MKNIVLYLAACFCFLILCHVPVSGQKPAIDLLPSDHQMDHPEAIADSGFSADTVIRPGRKTGDPDAFYVNGKNIKTLPVRKESKHNGIYSNERRLIRKKSPGKAGTEHRSLMTRPFYPVRLLTYLIALNP